MKILHLIYDHINNPWFGGGAAVRAYEVCKRLSKKHKITILAGKFPGANDYIEEGINFIFTGSDLNNHLCSTYSYLIAANLFLKRNKSLFDVVIEDFSPYYPVFSFLHRKDAVLQLHQKEGLHHIRKHLFLGIPFILSEILYPRFFNNLITVTELLKYRFRIADKNIAVISNGLDESLLLEPEETGDFLLFLGRLYIDQKGLDILNAAIGYLSARAKLIIAGSGIDNKRVWGLFGKQIESGQVKMPGLVKGKGKTELLRKCKFLIVPSRYEAQCIVVLEVAACGKPVIVSDIPELQYAVEAGFGIAFKSGDARDLAKKIEFLLANEALRGEMGRKAKEYAKDFTWERIADECEVFLVKTMSDSRGDYNAQV